MIHSEDNFNKNLPAGYDGYFDWDFFKEAGCWGNTKIEPMDFDGVVERHHHYLIFETKDEGIDVPLGQSITLDHLRNAKSFTVLTLWPKTPPFRKMELKHDNGKIEIIEGHQQIIQRVKDWYIFADRKKEV